MTDNPLRANPGRDQLSRREVLEATGASAFTVAAPAAVAAAATAPAPGEAIVDSHLDWERQLLALRQEPGAKRSAARDKRVWDLQDKIVDTAASTRLQSPPARPGRNRPRRSTCCRGCCSRKPTPRPMPSPICRATYSADTRRTFPSQ